LNSIKEAFKWIEEKFDIINVIVNNAGKAAFVKVLDEGDDVTEQLNSVINTNFTGLVHCSREAIKLIRKSGDYGMVINMSSISDSVIPFGYPRNVYPCTKHALKAFSEVLRQELIVSGDERIRVANLSPGAVKTEFRSKQPETIGSFFTNFPELASEDVAEAVVYLLSTPTNVNVTQLTIKPVGEKV
jgi:NADP-dependent 3-hydroxy acid dehydrogenase YdfG